MRSSRVSPIDNHISVELYPARLTSTFRWKMKGRLPWQKANCPPEMVIIGSRYLPELSFPRITEVKFRSLL